MHADRAPLGRDETFVFLRGIELCFTEEGSKSGFELVAARAVTDTDAVILYRDRPGGPVLGRLYRLKEYAALFSGASPELLADEAWHGDIRDPSGPGEVRAVEWASQIHDRPDEIRWIGLTTI
jgi:hypothetical protein